jgi:hypothetical protein
MTTEYLSSDARKLVEQLAAKSYFSIDPGTINEIRITMLVENTVREVCKMINAHMQYNNPNDCLLVLNIKENFGIEPNEESESSK